MIRRRRVSPLPTPSMLQMQETECGAIALGIVLAYHGLWVAPPELRRTCEVGGHGANAVSLMRAAKGFGLEARALRVPVDGLRSLPGPMVLHWQQRHFLVLEGISGDRVWLNDPAEGRSIVSLDVLRAGYSGIALVLEPAPAFAPSGAPPRGRNALAAVIAPGRRWLLVLGALAVLEAVALMVAIRTLGEIAGDAAVGWSVLVIALASLIALRGGQVALVDRAIEAIARPAQRTLLDDLRHVPSAFLTMRRPETLGGRLRLAEVPGTVVVQVVTSGVRALVGLPLMLALTAAVSPWVALTLAVMLVSTRWAQSRDVDAERAAMRTTGQAMALLRHGHAIRAGGEEADALSEALLAEPMPPTARFAGLRPFVMAAATAAATAAALTLPPVVAATLPGPGVGDVLVAALAGLFALRQGAALGEIVGSMAMLPGVVAQLRDSADERVWAERDRSDREAAA